jgi:hypothetical protein
MNREYREPGSATELSTVWRRHRLLMIVLLAAALGLCALVSSVMHVYSQSHYDYLTSVSTLSRQAAVA